MLNLHFHFINMFTNSKYKQLYGLIGYPLGHSFSQDYFNEKFEAERIDARYINFEIPTIEGLINVLEQNPNLTGFNVTIPYKEQIFNYLDEVDPEAKAIGAVNVVKVKRLANGKAHLTGYNSDYSAFGDTIAPIINSSVHRSALILGTGGASKAVAHALHNLGIQSIKVSRSKKGEGIITYDDLTPEIISEHKIVVNTTPVGMYPNVDDCPPIPYEALSSRHICYDLLYNPDETLFMRHAAAQGAVTKNGLEMLLLQAFMSWKIWCKY